MVESVENPIFENVDEMTSNQVENEMEEILNIVERLNVQKKRGMPGIARAKMNADMKPYISRYRDLLEHLNSSDDGKIIS